MEWKRNCSFAKKEIDMPNLMIRACQFHYEDLHQSQNEAILLIHGHPFDHSMWKYQYDALSDFRLILPDLRGYGKSDANFDSIFIEEQALDLALLLDELGIAAVHIIGLSMGGQISVEFHRLFPGRVKSLILCASTPHAETETSYQNRMNLATLIDDIGMNAYTQNDIHKYIDLTVHDSNSVVYSHLFKMMSQTSKEGAIASHKGRAERRDNFSHLKNIQIPCLVIAGETDFFFKTEDVKAVAAEIESSEFVLIHNSGHLPNMEQPVKFNACVKKFYEKINTG